MALILTIDTALENGSVGLFQDQELKETLSNPTQRDHAGFVQPAIDQLFKQANISMDQIDAIAVVNGPGSYTGLRVGLATAKGLCYALDKKLILLNTLDIMVLSSIQNFNSENYFYIPMIDARRSDVFMGIYDHKRALISTPSATTIGANLLDDYQDKNGVIASGSGAEKAAQIIQDNRLQIWPFTYSVQDINTLAQEKFSLKEFADVAYSEPNYLKAFYTTAKLNPSTK